VRIAVLHDEPPAEPRPDEQDTQAQARCVASHLEALGHEVARVPFGLDLGAVRRALGDLAPDVVVNLVESAGGSGRLIHLAPALLEVLGLRFTGASSAAMFATTHKLFAKRLLAAAGLPTPAWVEAEGAVTGRAPPAAFRPLQWIVKSVCEDASIGIGDDAVVEVAAPERLPALVAERAARLGGEAFAERYVESYVWQVKGAGGGLPMAPRTPAERLSDAWAETRRLVGRIWPFIVVGIAIGAVIHGYAPTELVASIGGEGNLLAVPMVVVLAVPLYSNAAGTIPIVQALLGKGLPLGTTLAFMMAVTAISLPELIILRRVMRLPLLVTFVAIVAGGILAIGYLFNALI